MKIASIQMSVVEGDKAATIDKAIENIHRCEGADQLRTARAKR
jgi:predicted amidohydrolase